MKTVNLAKGQGHIGIKYGVDPAPDYLKEKCPEGLRNTTLTIELPDGEVLTSKVGCHSGDQFVKRAGRFYTFLKLIEADNAQAEAKAMDDYRGEILKQPETEEGLAQAAKAHYKLSREDRRVIFAITCPELYKPTKAEAAIRRVLREKELLARLKAKYEPETIKIMTIAEQKAWIESLDIEPTEGGDTGGTALRKPHKKAAK